MSNLFRNNPAPLNRMGSSSSVFSSATPPGTEEEHMRHLHLGLDLVRTRVDAQRHNERLRIVPTLKPTLRQDVQTNLHKQRVLPQPRVVRAHDGLAGEGRADDDGEEVEADLVDGGLEQRGVLALVAVEALDELRARVLADAVREGDFLDHVEGFLAELLRGLVHELARDFLLDVLDGVLGVDDGEREVVAQLEERVFVLAEGVVALGDERFVEIRGADGDDVAVAGVADPCVVAERFLAALDLALDGDALGDVEDRDEESRLGVVAVGGRVGFAELDHLVVQQLENFDLCLCSGKSVDHHAVRIQRVQQLPKQRLHDDLRRNHIPSILIPLQLRIVHQIAHHDRLRAQPPHAQNKRRLLSLPRPGRAIQENNLPWKTQPALPAALP
eukprot:CAMPEP_0184722490 /NCGR_PEP_ID=MMETSP0314-20130426/22285_1 /TAXON_ID=38298 /ORGANISM="Rhodella maculata, Strain CCMP 736" /LENGTH=386 /DNA_ID=CAMNT_0027187099 /DNA_START=86 /DNA_END=1243 /DNA_ORIENTATION=+